MIVKHASSKVQKSDIALYLVGVNPIFARILLLMLVFANNGNVSVDLYVFGGRQNKSLASQPQWHPNDN